ncbi:uncharacterized protein LOC132854673 isoform X2 [Tachysurus vachellii]|uniref:uncharacterized protein LOC132854673 isoform X2 n=1 Tax=Tachysurus vachellii TaxID=175792 RepID=UPI00296ADE9F|nr:uncharacterized protein LOC132854673 isoform X2 [Tachysurus vachellii]
MQFCSLHQCVLFFLIFMFTTAPTLAFTSVMVKLNQSAVLPCKQNCSYSMWTVIDEPCLIVAECNQTSCWSKEGFNMSHDQYLKGDLSLNINAADYSNRGLYTCECAGEEVNTVQLSIETRMLSANLKSGDDLILHLHKSNYMELIYKSKDSPDLYGEQICNVTEDSLQCNDDYKQRALLKDSIIILKNLKPSDSGVYTIRDTLYKCINLIYTLSVKDISQISQINVNRHGSVTLKCTQNCTGLVEWTKNKKHVVAWCNQTSCNPEKGYNISYDQYLKGDLSLTITDAYYSMRGVYFCMCNKKRISEFDVSIQTENSSVQLKPGEDLLMDLPRSEPVEVIYRSTRSFADDADGKNICIFEDDFLECIVYTHRISPVLKLEHVNLTDSGVYTIQSRNTQEAFFNYSVSVEGNIYSVRPAKTR